MLECGKSGLKIYVGSCWDTFIRFRVRNLTIGSPYPRGKCIFPYMLFNHRNFRPKTRTQCWSAPKFILKFTLGLVETHSSDFGPPAIPWVAPPPGQMWFSHIRFCYRNFRPTNRTQWWSVPIMVLHLRRVLLRHILKILVRQPSHGSPHPRGKCVFIISDFFIDMSGRQTEPNVGVCQKWS